MFYDSVREGKTRGISSLCSLAFSPIIGRVLFYCLPRLTFWILPKVIPVVPYIPTGTGHKRRRH